MALHAVVIKDGAVSRHDITGRAIEVYITRGEGGDVTVRVFDRQSHYGGQGGARDVNSFVMTGSNEAVRVVLEEHA